MFTGIIENLGQVLSHERSASSSRLRLETSFGDLELGESVAVNGACLTVVESDASDVHGLLVPRTSLAG